MDTSEPRAFSAPVSGASGRLVFRRGAANVTITSDSALAQLYQAEFTDPVPDVRTLGNNVEITYRLAMADWLKGWWLKDRTSAKITLSRSIPWQFEFRGGLSHLHADLRDIIVHAISIIGGASDVELLLPRVTTQVPVTITGGASHVRLLHPPETGVKLHIIGGATKVRLGEQYLGAMGGEIVLQTPTFKENEGHISFEVKGGITDVDVVLAEETVRVES